MFKPAEGRNDEPMAPTLPGGAGASFGSGLSIPDFAACLAMGLQPLGLVQGFYCGMVSSWSSYSGYPLHTYPCACYEVQAHQTGWIGTVDDLDRAWANAYQTALDRMLDEAKQLGAHGVVGVRTDMAHPTNENSCEVHLYGTAVHMAGAPVPAQPWSTRLAGQKLAKLVEIGFVPDSVGYARSTIMMVEGCNMEQYGSGRVGSGYVIHPLQEAHERARTGAIAVARSLRRGASLYDVSLDVHESERYRSVYITCSLQGSIVVKAVPTMPIPTPAVTLNVGL